MKKSVIIMIAVGAWGYSFAQDTVSSSQSALSVRSQMELTPSYFLNKVAKLSAMEIEAGQLAQQKAQNAGVKAYGSRMVRDHGQSSDQLRALAIRKNITLSMAREGQASWPAQKADASTGVARIGSATTTTRDTSSNTVGMVKKSTAGTETSATGRTSTGNENMNANTSGQYTTQTDTGKYASHQDKLNQLRQSTGANFDREYMTMMVEDHIRAISLFEKVAELDDADIKAFAAQTLPVLRDHLAAAEKILSTLASANR